MDSTNANAAANMTLPCEYGSDCETCTHSNKKGTLNLPLSPPSSPLKKPAYQPPGRTPDWEEDSSTTRYPKSSDSDTDPITSSLKVPEQVHLPTNPSRSKISRRILKLYSPRAAPPQLSLVNVARSGQLHYAKHLLQTRKSEDDREDKSRTRNDISPSLSPEILSRIDHDTQQYRTWSPVPDRFGFFTFPSPHSYVIDLHNLDHQEFLSFAGHIRRMDWDRKTSMCPPENTPARVPDFFRWLQQVGKPIYEGAIPVLDKQARVDLNDALGPEPQEITFGYKILPDGKQDIYLTSDERRVLRKWLLEVEDKYDEEAEKQLEETGGGWTKTLNRRERKQAKALKSMQTSLFLGLKEEIEERVRRVKDGTAELGGNMENKVSSISGRRRGPLRCTNHDLSE